MTEQLDELIGLLDLEQIEENLFRGFHPAGRTHRLFGGQIIAQALVAAARTVPAERQLHSLHAYFLRPGNPKIPAVFDVERIRDGNSFTTRRIVVIQGGEAIYTMDASFQVQESGLSHQASMPDLSPPDEATLPAACLGDAFISFRVDNSRLLEERPQPPQQHLWLKINGVVPDNPLLHMALLAYESDSALLGTARLPHRGSFKRERLQMASLDHSMWFHAGVNVNNWMLYTLESPSSSRARGFNRGTIFAADGTLVASTMQEGLMRLWPDPGDGGIKK